MEVDASMSGDAEQALPPSQAQVLSGPRPAPSFRVVNHIVEKKEDGPGPRCGHTLTAVGAVGEEGKPGYIGPRLILFGGATALEGNTAAVGPQPPSGNAGISRTLSRNLVTVWLCHLHVMHRNIVCFKPAAVTCPALLALFYVEPKPT